MYTIPAEMATRGVVVCKPPCVAQPHSLTSLNQTSRGPKSPDILLNAGILDDMADAWRQQVTGVPMF